MEHEAFLITSAPSYAEAEAGTGRVSRRPARWQGASGMALQRGLGCGQRFLHEPAEEEEVPYEDALL